MHGICPYLKVRELSDGVRQMKQMVRLQKERLEIHQLANFRGENRQLVVAEEKLREVL